VLGEISREMNLLSILVMIVATIALVTDLLFRKIPNVLTFSTMLLGCGLAFWDHSWKGLGFHLLAVVLGFGLYLGIYLAKALGAGDVKLLMAFGALTGPKGVLDIGFLAIFIGAVMAVMILITRGRIAEFLHKMFRFVYAFEKPQVDHKLKMPFGVALSLSAVMTVLYHPLESWGLRFWGSL